MTESDMTGVTVRAATARDTGTILRLIRELAEYEGRADDCTVTEPVLQEALFEARPHAEVLLAEEGGASVGFAFFLTFFSPTSGVLAHFIELLYVVQPRRGIGIGSALL